MSTFQYDKKKLSRRKTLVFAGGSLAFFVMVAGCGGSHDSESAPSAAAPPPVASASADDASTATVARTAIDELHASWQPYVTDVKFSSGVLRVALQIDRDKEKPLAEEIAGAIKNLVTLTPDLSNVEWIEVTDGAGVHITQIQANK